MVVVGKVNVITHYHSQVIEQEPQIHMQQLLLILTLIRFGMDLLFLFGLDQMKQWIKNQLY